MAFKRWNIHGLACFVGLGGLFWGLDTGLIGPVTVMPQFLEAFPEAKNTAIQGTLVATILMAGALTSLTSGSISDKFSRKRTIMIGAIVAAVGCFLEAGSVELWMLILGRLIAGAGEGLFVNTISVYLVEISPPAVRGSTSCTFQLLITVGIVIGYFMCYFSVSIGSSLSFRIPFIVQGIACCTLAIGVPFIPHSPRWLVAQGREEEAWHVISLFDPEGAHLQREKIQEAIQRERGYHQSLRERMVASEDNSSGYLHSCMAFVKGNEHIAAVMDAFGKGKKGRTVFGVALMGLQQLSGIDAVLFYAPVLFTQAGLGSRKASFLASGVSGIVNLLAVIPAQFYLVDKWGRRPCCITGGLLMCVCMTVIGSMYASGLAKQTGGRWTVIAMIYLFIAVFSMTWAVAGKILTTEMQPAKTRATASSLAQTSNWTVNVVVALTTPLFLSKSPSGPYFMFGGFLLVTSLMCILWAPETLGKSLEDIDSVWHERVDRAKRLLCIEPEGREQGIRRQHGDIELASTA